MTSEVSSMPGDKSVVVLISGRGSNMIQLAQSSIRPCIRKVICNRPAAAGIPEAERLGIYCETVDHKSFSSREAFEEELVRSIERNERQEDQKTDLVILAGFMRVLGRDITRHYQGRMINIHPSLLPAFPGLNTHQRAIDAGVKLHGCTVHFVQEEVDAGAIIAQGVVPVFGHDNEQELADRVLKVEHQLLPDVALRFLKGEFSLKDGRTVWRKDIHHLESQTNQNIINYG